MEPICMVANCTNCAKLTFEDALLEDDYARLRSLQTSQAEYQSDKPQVEKRDTIVKAKDDANEVANEESMRERSHIGSVKLRDRKSRGQVTGSQRVANRNLSFDGSSVGNHGNDSISESLNYQTRPNANVVYRRNANKVVSSSSDEEGIICGCMANSSSVARQRTMSLYEPYIRDIHNANANRNTSDSDSDNSVASCRCRRTRSMYGMRPRKLDGAEEGLFSDVIDSYLAKSQSLSGGFDARINRYSLGDMPWLNEEEMNDGFLRQRAQRNGGNSSYWRDNNSAVYDSGNITGLHGNMVVDNSFFQKMRENLHQFDRNNRRNQKQHNESELIMKVKGDDNSSSGGGSCRKGWQENEIQCLQNTHTTHAQEDSNCQFSQNDRNHLHQSCDLIAQKIGESEQKSKSMFEITEAHRERQQNEDYYDSDASDESRLSLSYFVDMEKSVIIQSDITEHYRTDKIQYLESTNVDSSDEAASTNDTPATYKYNANTQKDLDPSKMADTNNKQHLQLQHCNARFKTETKTTLLDKTDRSNQNALKTSTSGEICNEKIEVEKDLAENEEKPKSQESASPHKKPKDKPVAKPRPRLGNQFYIRVISFRRHLYYLLDYVYTKRNFSDRRSEKIDLVKYIIT